MTRAYRDRPARVAAVLAVVAGLLAMHGLTAPAWAAAAAAASSRPAAGAETAMPGMTTGGGAVHHAAPGNRAPASPHHGPAARDHHPCLAVPATSVAFTSPGAARAPAPPALPALTTAAATPGARLERAPPDLNGLCVSRT
ncbi:MAG: DUF6153 family protein [Actinobacteria bacterium]|nr:DUF6153 family protein [Actinomycetota bacterium]MCA1720028.1 DUF6153 family protein [Actinomycetota bacterium]